MSSKSCGTCTRCCEGWFSADIKGHKMDLGKPCYFIEIGKGCTIYNDRPQDPCKNFLCGWMLIDEMPDEFKPENSGVIMHWRKEGYWVLTKAPNNPSHNLLSWAIFYAKSKEQNIVWYTNDRGWWLGDDDFCKKMEVAHGV